MLRNAVLVASFLLLLIGCSDESAHYPSSRGMSPPYILKEDCTFSIIEERSKASVTSPTVKGAESSTAIVGASLGDKSIKVQDCEVIENSHGLPIYED